MGTTQDKCVQRSAGPPRDYLAAEYKSVPAGRPATISFITVGELRYGARVAGWGAKRLQRLVAATAMRLDVPLVAHDAIFTNVANLKLITKLDPR